MTGRELILYIMENGLEDEPIFKDGKLVGFLTEGEMAAKLEVGVATVRLYALMGLLDSIQIGEMLYFPLEK